MITVPVTIGFDYRKLIGNMTINEELLPEDHNFCFSTGMRLYNGKYTLMCIALIDNESYKAYLDSDKYEMDKK